MLPRLRYRHLGRSRPWRNFNASFYLSSMTSIPTYTQPFSPANPSFTVEELRHQLSVTRAKVIIAHPVCLSTARDAARAYGIPYDSLIVLDSSTVPNEHPFPTIGQLIQFGASKGENYKAISFKPGEAKATIAFLSFSSGTTGTSVVISLTWKLDLQRRFVRQTQGKQDRSRR